MRFAKDVLARAAASERGARHIDADGTELATIAKVDAVQLIHGRGKRLFQLELSYALARALAWDLARWWVLQTWCGFREQLLRRALRRAFESAGKTPREMRDAPRP